ncbi:hypothetical protein ITP53_53275 [Nonomuraea sp. K274]|uniref:Uncharacterized protein n=1 Tax=Nonomuraea cypriaca TaxID=1187855 RepID=A0A931APN8_9ACTN|nr:hypothetical protein [Nonomuraea cypriaca]MBF8194294.1 hypothetical protein [Nonomuraea cypriaca]
MSYGETELSGKTGPCGETESYGETDELTFGDDREPRLRAWAAAHRRVLAIVVAAAVAVAGLGFGGTYLYQRSLLPSPPPDVPFPPVDGIEIGVCLGRDMGCQAGTVEQVTALARGIPELTSVTVVSGEEDERRFRELTIAEGLVANRNPGTYFRVEARLRRAEDYKSVERRLTGKPGVWIVSPSAADFWAGRAHVGVYLCGPRRSFSECGDGPATPVQRDAVVAGLRESDGVEEVFLQDRELGLRLANRFEDQRPATTDDIAEFTIDDVSEVLYVRLADPGKARATGQAVLRMPGVGWARLVR